MKVLVETVVGLIVLGLVGALCYTAVIGWLI